MEPRPSGAPAAGAAASMGMGPNRVQTPLALRAAGLKDPGVEAALAALQPGAELPAGFARLSPERATRILARGGERPAPSSGTGRA